MSFISLSDGCQSSGTCIFLPFLGVLLVLDRLLPHSGALHTPLWGKSSLYLVDVKAWLCRST